MLLDKEAVTIISHSSLDAMFNCFLLFVFTHELFRQIHFMDEHYGLHKLSVYLDSDLFFYF